MLILIGRYWPAYYQLCLFNTCFGYRLEAFYVWNFITSPHFGMNDIDWASLQKKCFIIALKQTNRFPRKEGPVKQVP